jgi:hypothetical protein
MKSHVRVLQEGGERLPLDVTQQTAVAFVENLEIEVLGTGRLWRSGNSAALGDVRAQQPSANVVAASVVAFSDGIFGQQKEDLLNSTLLAQLAANKKYDRERDTLNWYTFYRSVLEQLGWIIEKQRPSGRLPDLRKFVPSRNDFPNRPTLPGRPAGFTFTRVVVDRPRFTAGSTVMKVLHKKVNENIFIVTQAALEALSDLDDRDRRVIIFENSSHSSGRGNFQIVSVSVEPPERLRMTMVAVFFATDERVSRVLSFNFAGGSTQMFQARDTMTLDSAVYDAVRDQVIQQLGDQASAYIDELDIA